MFFPTRIMTVHCPHLFLLSNFFIHFPSIVFYFLNNSGFSRNLVRTQPFFSFENLYFFWGGGFWDTCFFKCCVCLSPVISTVLICSYRYFWTFLQREILFILVDEQLRCAAVIMASFWSILKTKDKRVETKKKINRIAGFTLLWFTSFEKFSVQLLRKQIQRCYQYTSVVNRDFSFFRINVLKPETVFLF